jgi:hypothetical protein
LPEVKISPERVTGPEQGESSGRVLTLASEPARLRIHLDRLQNKYANCKGVKNNSNFGQIAGIKEKLDTTCKQNAS